jgi:hypothetical protein
MVSFDRANFSPVGRLADMAIGLYLTHSEQVIEDLLDFVKSVPKSV